jgi:hypothetical protein
MLLISFLSLYSCGKKNEMIGCDDQFGSRCQEAKVVEHINNMPAWIVHVKNEDLNIDHWYISTAENSSIPGTDENTLVPCNNEVMPYPRGTRVLITGKRLNCCGVITHPSTYASWGCKFKIENIQPLNN